MNCVFCGEGIPPERLEVLPDTQTCVKCTTEAKKLCVPSYPHKTGGTIIVIDAEDKETIRRAQIQYRRTRWAG